MTQETLVALATMVSTVVSAVMAFVVARMKQQVVQESRKTTSLLDEMAEVGVKTHTLVNSRMGAQLRLTADVSRRLAMITKDPADVEAANIAEDLLREHESKQATVDAQSVEQQKPTSGPIH